MRLLPIAILSVVFCSIGLPAFAVTTDTKTEQKSVEIHLDSESNDLTKQIDLSQYDIPMPAVCAKANVHCEESSNVNIKITRKWNITSVYELTHPRLTAEDFSQYYPDLSEEKPLQRNSDPKQVMLLQRALYERGMLESLPTGRYGAQTQRAVLHFNIIKGLNTCDGKTSVASRATLRAINALKRKMSDTNYLRSTKVPAMATSSLCPPTQKELAMLDAFAAAARRGEVKQVVTNTKKDKVGVVVGGKKEDTPALRVDGFVKIAK